MGGQNSRNAAEKENELSRLVPNSDGNVQEEESSDSKEADSIDNVEKATGDKGQTSKEESSGTMSDSIAGVVVAAVAAACLVMSSAASQFLVETIPHAELNASRFFGQTVIVTPFVCWQRCDVRIERRHIKSLIIVVLMYTATSYTWYGATYYLPLGTVSIVARGLVAILAWGISIIVYRDFQKYLVLGLLFCVTSIVFVTQPDFMFDGLFPPVQINRTFGEEGCVAVCNVSAADAPVYEFDKLRAPPKSLSRLCGGGASSSLSSSASLEGDLVNDSLALMHNCSSVTDSPDSYALDPVALHRKKLIAGYIMLLIHGFASVTKDFVVNKSMKDLHVYKFTFITGILSIPTSLLVMAATETPTIPTCWLCWITVVVHGIGHAIYTLLWYWSMQRIHPLTSNIVINATMMVLSFSLQYTSLSMIHGGHRNWLEYTGAGLAVFSVVAGPMIKICMMRRKEKQDAADSEESNSESTTLKR